MSAAPTSCDQAVLEEGARQGTEIAAQEDFMTVSIEAAAGSVEALRSAMRAAETAANDVHTKDQGRRRVGMMFVSHGGSVLAITASVPPDRRAEAPAREWVRAVLEAVGGREVEGGGDGEASAVCEGGTGGVFTTPSGKTFSQAEAFGFEATKASVAWLRERSLFPPKEEEGDDIVFEW
mmetsp:Transcript_15136/g.34891  ORF Transcript_15136/g.34891 Transcript_15136/m.34891 type:complete len:179 (-) Transcript_15136:50-586(-)